MSGTGGTSGPEDSPGAAPPSGFLAELAEAFRRHRPQGSNRWNFSDAFNRLDRQFGAGRASGPGRPDDASSAGGAHGPPGARQGVGRFLDRSARVMRRPSVQGRAVPAPGEDPATSAAGFNATLEAFRYLVARVERLEDEAESRRAPVDAMPWLVPTPPLGPWVAPVAEFLAGAHRSGEVVHGECDEGELALALMAAGLPVRGVEPRGAVAWRAAERGVDVYLGPVPEMLAAVPAGSLGGLVLSGVVDRLAVEDLVELLAVATDRLGDGAPLVVVGSAPGTAGSHWDAVARDLVPGRPLSAQTWELLLTRSGYEEVAPVDGPGGSQPVFTVKGRRPR